MRPKLKALLEQSNRKLVLIGLPGVGKTTLAKLLDENWRDTDKEMELQGWVVPKYPITRRQMRWRWNGIAKFVEAEHEALHSCVAMARDMKEYQCKVVATGGSVVLNEKAREMLKWDRCFTVWIVGNKVSGGLGAKLYARLSAERNHLYDECADLIWHNEQRFLPRVSADLLVEAVIHELEKEITG